MAKGISSMLLNAANNIVSTNRSTSQMKRSQTTYQDFVRFMQLETNNLKAIKFNQRKLKKALGANVAVSFGSAGNLLSGLASGALDAASFVGDFFGKKGGKPNLAKPNTKAGQPVRSGSRIKIPGVRALGVLTPLLAGLDFAQGISQGESTGKAAAGAAGSAAGGIAGAAAGGALAGAITSGMIGQGLVPIPGLGFVLGAAVGGLGAFAGGYFADRAYEATEKNAKQKIESKLKIQEAKQKEAAAAATKLSLPEVLDKFDSVVYNFEKAVIGGFLGPSSLQSSEGVSEEDGEIMEGDQQSPPNTNQQEGETGEYDVSGGSTPSSKRYSPFGPRKGRNHNGIDYSVRSGTPISVVQPGTVTVANMNYDPTGWGALVEVQHQDGSTTRYAHLSKISVSEGQKIEPGTLIGYSGGSPGAPGAGNSRGEHLHYEYLPRGSGPVDPAAGNNDDKYFRFGGNIRVKPSVKPQQNISGNSVETQQTTSQVSQQELSRMSTDQLKGMLDPNKTGASNPAVLQAASKAREDAKVKGMSGDDLERQVLIASIQASQVSPTSNVVATSQQITTPQQIQQYPSYNMPQSSVTLIPILSGNGNQKPVVISTPNGGSQTVVVSGPSEGQVLNSLYKNILLTSLSAT